MKYAFVADVHVHNFRKFGGRVESGINERARAVLDTLKCAHDYALNAQCDRFIILGDLFEVPHPTPQLIAAVARILSSSERRMRVTIIPGNHDKVSMAQDDHALAPFLFMQGISVVDQSAKLDGNVLGLIPHHPGPIQKWLPEEFAKVRGSEIVGVHFGIYDDDTPGFLRSSEGAASVGFIEELCDEFDVGGVVAGDWHHSREWKDREHYVAIPGALSPKSFADVGVRNVGRMVVWEDGKTVLQMMPGVRFQKLSLDKFKKRNKERSHTHFFKLVLHPDELEEAQELTRADNVTHRCEFEVSTEAADLALSDAADAARSADNFDEALAEFIEGVSIADPGTLDGVKSRVMNYRKRVMT